MKRRKLFLFAAAVVAVLTFAGYRSLSPNPLAVLYSLKPASVQTASKAESRSGKQLTTFKFQGPAAYASLEALKGSLIGKRGWYLRASDDNYAFFSDTQLAGQGNEIDWYLTDDRAGQAVIHAAMLQGEFSLGSLWVSLGRRHKTIVIPPPSASSGWTSADGDLGIASQQDNLGVAEDAIKRGAQVNGVGSGNGPLYWALTGKGQRVAELLISKGANVNALDDNGEPLIDQMARNGKADAIRLLQKHGARLGRTAQAGLFIASQTTSPTDMLMDFPDPFFDEGWLTDDSWKNSGDCAEAMIDSGADVNGRDSTGHTPIFYAARNGNARVLAVLFDHGAIVPEGSDKHGQTLRELAESRHRNQWKKVVAMIAKYDQAVRPASKM